MALTFVPGGEGEPLLLFDLKVSCRKATNGNDADEEDTESADDDNDEAEGALMLGVGSAATSGLS